MPIENAGTTPQQIAVTVDLEPEKPVDIDVAQLLEKNGEGDAKKSDDEVVKAAPKDDKNDKDDKDDGVEIEVDTDDGTKEQQDNEVIADLKAQLDSLRERSERERQDIDRERKAREDAERTAQQAREQVQQSQLQLLQSNQQAITHAIAAEKADADALERAYAQALHGNDHATAAKCQRALARVEARLLQFEEGKAQLDEMIKAGPKAWPQQRQQQPQKTADDKPASSGDPVEDYYRTRSPRVEQFLRKHDRTWISDKKTNDRLVAAHFAAIAADHVNESDSYFDFIEKQMNPTTKKEPQREAKPVKKVVAAAPASAVKAASAAGNGISGTKVHLTPRERESARFQGLTEAEYARRKYLMSRPDWDGPKFD